MFSRVSELKKIGLEVPQVTELAYELSLEGVPIKTGILTAEEFTEEICRLYSTK